MLNAKKKSCLGLIAYFAVFILLFGCKLSVNLLAAERESLETEQSETENKGTESAKAKDAEAESIEAEQSETENKETKSAKTKNMETENIETISGNATGTLLAKSNSKSVKILLVGNSLTKYGSHANGHTIQGQLEKMAVAAGRKVTIKTVAHGGAKLKDYAGMTKEYKAYREELLDALRSQNWDYVVLQEYSRTPYFHYERDTVPAVEWLRKKIKQIVPEAEVLLYMTSAHDYRYENEAGEKVTLSAYDMELHTAAAYARLGDKFDIDVVPVGMQFYRSALVYPEIELLGPDNRHPSQTGYFLAAGCIYYRIFGNKPPLEKEVLNFAGVTRNQGKKLNSLLGDGIASNITEKNMQAGDSATMKVHSIQGEDIPELRYFSLDEAVAKVNQKGKIKAVGSGQTVIVAETWDGQQAFCTVYVAYKRPQNVKAEIYDRQVRNNNKVRVKISWNKVEGASYQVYRAPTKNGTYKLLATVSKTLYIDKNAKPGRTWYYKVVASNGYSGCESRASKVVKVFPLKVQKLKVKTTGETRAKLTWKKNKKAAGYMVYRATSKKGSYRKLAEITSKDINYYVDKNRNAGKTYYYKLVAYGED